MTGLHVTYAPILRFNKEELFFPMRVEDMLSYCSLHVKGQDTPVVPRGQVTFSHLQQYGQAPQAFLRSVEVGPLRGEDVVSQWSTSALEMVYRAAVAQPASLLEDLARRAYDWFSPKTQAAAQLFWWNALLAQVLTEAVRTAPGELPRLILPGEMQRAAADEYQTRFGRSPAYTYYYRQMRDGNYLCLQYWFFYSFNDWGCRFRGFNDHEGDWEGMMLFFRLDTLGRPQEPPAYITFADHESRQTKPWDHPDVTRIGTHPVGFVGGGSHATYPQARVQPLVSLYSIFDYATGDGVTIDHDDWVYRLDLDQSPWLGDYKGSWGTRFWLSTAQARTMLGLALLTATPLAALASLTGPPEIELPGVSAPRGPVGSHRPQYASPVAWAGVPA